MTEELKENIFIVNAPLQLINAYEAQHHFNLPPEKCSLICLDTNTDERMHQIMRLKNRQCWPHTIILPSNKKDIIRKLNKLKDSSVGSMLFHIADEFLRKLIRNPLEYTLIAHSALKELNKLSQRARKPDMLFIGYYGSPLMRHFANTIKPLKTYIVDDGKVTIDHYRAVLHPDKYDIRIQFYTDPLMNILRRIFFGFNLKPFNEFNYFTVFSDDCKLISVPPVNIEKNNLTMFRSAILDGETVQELYFLGEFFVPRHQMTCREYADYLQVIASQFSDHKMVYIPHPRMPDDILNELKGMVSFQCRRLDSPIESELAEMNKRPAIVASFNSTALMNIAMLFLSIRVINFRIDLPGNIERFKKYDTQFFNDVDEYFDKRIDVIHLRDLP